MHSSVAWQVQGCRVVADPFNIHTSLQLRIALYMRQPSFFVVLESFFKYIFAASRAQREIAQTLLNSEAKSAVDVSFLEEVPQKSPLRFHFHF